VRREMFVCPLAINASEFLRAQDCAFEPLSRPAAELAAWFKRRWMTPRAARIALPEWSPDSWLLYRDQP
jgi:hypothetical protein